jgi:hypothetical protein
VEDYKKYCVYVRGRRRFTGNYFLVAGDVCARSRSFRGRSISFTAAVAVCDFPSFRIFENIF